MLELFYIQLVSVITMNIAIKRGRDVLYYVLNSYMFFLYFDSVSFRGMFGYRME